MIIDKNSTVNVIVRHCHGCGYVQTGPPLIGPWVCYGCGFNNATTHPCYWTGEVFKCEDCEECTPLVGSKAKKGR